MRMQPLSITCVETHIIFTYMDRVKTPKKIKEYLRKIRSLCLKEFQTFDKPYRQLNQSDNVHRKR